MRANLPAEREREKMSPIEFIKRQYCVEDRHVNIEDIGYFSANELARLIIDYEAQQQVKVEPEVKVNFADIKEIYEKYDIPMDADAEGLQPLYYSGKLLREFIGDLNAYFEKCI